MNIGMVGPFNPSFIVDRFVGLNMVPDINSGATSVNTTVKKLVELGHHVTVFTSYQFFGRPYEIQGDGINVVFVSSAYVKKGLGKSIVSFQLKQELKKRITDLDVLHAQWTYEYAYAVIGFKDQIPILCSVRDWFPYLKSKMDIKNLLSAIAVKYTDMVFYKIMKTEQFIFIANSNYTYNCIKNEFPNNHIIIIPNPIESDRILDKRENYPTKQTFISISVSLEEKRKNYDTLLKAFREYSKDNEALLILVGDYSAEWKSHYEKIGLLTNVELAGKLNRDELYYRLDTSSCLIHPSVEETFGNILLEAMARRVPCIGGINSGAVPQVLGNGKYGILCDVEDIDSIVEAMKMSTDYDVTSDYVNRSTDNLKLHYSDTVVALRHLEIYKYCLAGKH